MQIAGKIDAGTVTGEAVAYARSVYPSGGRQELRRALLDVVGLLEGAEAEADLLAGICLELMGDDDEVAEVSAAELREAVKAWRG